MGWLWAAVMAVGCASGQQLAPGIAPGQPQPQPEPEQPQTCSGAAGGPRSLELKVLSFNLWMLPPGLSNATSERNQMIGEAIAKDAYDVLLFQEAWNADLRQGLVAALKAKGYNHVTDVPSDTNKLMGGGVFIASRHPIMSKATHVFHACYGADCATAMGFGYANLCVWGRPVHVINVHTESSNQQTRAKQFFELAAWISTATAAASPAAAPPPSPWGQQWQAAAAPGVAGAATIPASEPLLVGGDLNVDGPATEFGSVMAQLQTTPARLDDASPLHFSWDPAGNAWAQAQAQAHGTQPLLLDHVLASTTHLRPASATAQVLRFQAPTAAGGLAQGADLSDHHPLMATFSFQYP